MSIEISDIYRLKSACQQALYLLEKSIDYNVELKTVNRDSFYYVALTKVEEALDYLSNK